MNVIAIRSSGNQTSLCAIIKDDVVQYSLKHERKERPNWSEMLSFIGLDSFLRLRRLIFLHMQIIQTHIQLHEVLQLI